MQGIRSRLFDILVMVWTALFYPALALLLVLGKPRAAIRAVSRVWSAGILFLLKRIVGLGHDEVGRANIPTEPCLIVANHQSEWETIAFLVLVRDVAIVAKKELLRVPVMGWFLLHSPMIMIDRDSGSGALRHMLGEARAALAGGRSVLIFPEGSRRSAGSVIDFKRGIELLYSQLRVPVLPVALNSGHYWSTSLGPKLPGRITVAFLPVIPPGLPSSEFRMEVEKRVGDALASAEMAPS